MSHIPHDDLLLSWEPVLCYVAFCFCCVGSASAFGGGFDLCVFVCFMLAGEYRRYVASASGRCKGYGWRLGKRAGIESLQTSIIPFSGEMHVTVYSCNPSALYRMYCTVDTRKCQIRKVEVVLFLWRDGV